MPKQYNILHIDTELTWRGGERQLALLVKGLRTRGFSSALLAPPDSAIAEALKHDCTVIPQSMKGAGGSLSTVRKLAHLMQSSEFSVIHAHTGRAHSLVVAAKFLSGSKTPVVVHRRVDYRPGKNPFSMWKYRTKLIDHYVCVSNAIAKILAESSLDGGANQSSRISVVHSATDPSPFRHLVRTESKTELGKKFRLDPNKIWICNASALTEQKGYPVLLEALAKLKSSGLNFHCIIAGDGPLKKNLEDQSKNLGIFDNITFLGFIKNVPELLTSCEILAVPSLFEGLGTIIQDGIYAGCAIAASSVGGIPEMIENEVSGLLSAPGDSQELFQNLVRLCQSADLRLLFASQAKKSLEQNFSVDAMVEGNIEIYKKLIGRS